MSIEILEPIQVEYDLDNSDDKRMYDEMLDECHDTVNLAGLHFDASDILENCDPIAYRCGFNDYVDGLPERWKCPSCGAKYEDQESAKWCHQDKPDEEEESEDEDKKLTSVDAGVESTRDAQVRQLIKEVTEHTTFLTLTLIPDLNESGRTETAEDFVTSVNLLQRAIKLITE